ncbi:hypothetical protein [Nonomuraea diastatica]|uniref:Uncharacterized protein n=1 Tax=Nonomuraea diastatica TaxID=1848329 RepID=A0A4R4WBI8_9ACTN|nr:hypothetical protein [Nonomuraea diastatica]TDD12665.1 hypothetical protein E1294_43350 [Nonomuraea diastatica]
MASTTAAFAPYAQAAVSVDKDGTAVRSKNVTDVKRVATGKYLITVDPQIDAGRSVPQATIHRTGNWGSEIYVGSETDANDTNVFLVWTGVNAAASDQPFHFIVP